MTHPLQNIKLYFGRVTKEQINQDASIRNTWAVKNKSDMLFAHQEKQKWVSNQSQELNINNLREQHTHAQLSTIPRTKLKIMKNI